jgi:hypothetical protein
MKDKTCRDLLIFRKTTKSLELRFKQNEIPRDISGWTIYFTAKKSMEDPDVEAVITKDITSHLDAENGKTLIELDTDDTDLQGSYSYDIKYKDIAGNAGILFHGRILFREPVTTRG